MLTPLPIDSVLPEIIGVVRTCRAAVVVAPPGAGKTTRVPPAIITAKLLPDKHPNLVMLQPRRVAARAAAVRIAEENNWALGQEVGYHVRFEKVLNAKTPIRVLTEGILNRQLLDDPFLDGIGCVILDEFHERSIHTDLAISLLREVRESVRDDLILIVMSATLHAEPVAAFLGNCPVIRSPGRMFDIQIEHRPPSGNQLEDRVAKEVRDVLSLPPSQSGDVLVFLPGSREIQQTLRLLQSTGELVLPLHGSLPFEEQVRALHPSDRRKVILATNIAETSLTIPGIRTVIDSGLVRQSGFDPRRGLDQLELKRVSRASAEQRAGRAGRTATGRCIRLWTAKEHAALDEFDRPEIFRVDLSTTVLGLGAWGKSDPRGFAWYEPPSDDSLAAAERLLWLLGAVTTEKGGKITPLGRRMMDLPVHPRLSRLLIAAADNGMARQGAGLAAWLSEDSAASTGAPAQTHAASDLLMQLDRSPSGPALRLGQQLLRLIHSSKEKNATEANLLKLALLAYPDRVCRRRAGDPERAVMVGGIGVRLARESVVRTAEFFVAVDVRYDDRSNKGESLVRIASAIEPAWLDELFPASVRRRESVQYDAARQRVVGVGQNCYLDLILSEETDAAVDSNSAAAALATALRPRAAEIFAADESAAMLLARIEFLRKWMPEHPWPVFDATHLATVLEQACAGKRSLDELKRTPLSQYLLPTLPYPLDRLLDQYAPQAMELPSGKHIKLRYEPSRPPILAARLQEFFGWTQTPRLANGRVPLVLEILGPNYRPVQITDDLASFWKKTYAQVRKDLRRRYPKHAWPENPR